MISKNILLSECLPYIIFQKIIGTTKLETRKMKMSFSCTIRKHHRSVGLNSRNVLSHSSESQMSEIAVTADFIPPEASFLGLKMLAFSCVLMWPFFCVHTPLVSLRVSKPFLMGTQVRLDQSYLMDSFQLTISFKALSPDRRILRYYWGLGLQLVS